MKKYSYVIFDLDGTLLNTSQGIQDSVSYTVEKLNLPPLSKEKLDSVIGPPIGQSLQRIYGLDDGTRDEAVEIFRNRYKNHDLLKAFAYDGLYDLLSHLADNNILMAIATYKRFDYAKMISTHFEFDKYMKYVEGSDFESKLTKFDILSKTVELGEIDKSSCVMIGDTSYDGYAANKLGVDFIAVSYGYGFKGPEDLTDIDYVCLADSPLEIKRFLSEE